MLLNFRHGIIKAGSATFQSSPSAVSINVSSGNALPLEVNITDGDNNYYHVEAVSSTSNNDKWLVSVSSETVYLYIDIDNVTGTRTMGVATQNQIVSATTPVSPASGQHWFDTTNNKMKYYVGLTNTWIECIRIFVAIYVDGNVTQYSPNRGSQIDVSVGSHRVGRIIYDSNGTAIRTSDGSFLTTESDFITYGGAANVSRLESDVTLVKASQNIPAFSVVAIKGYGDGAYSSIELADYTDVENTILAMTAETLTIGQITNINTRGIITNSDWDWQTDLINAGGKLWVGTGENKGQLVGIDPYIQGLVPTQKPPVAKVMNSSAVLFQQTFESVGPKGDAGEGGGGGGGPANYIIKELESDVVEYTLTEEDKDTAIIFTCPSGSNCIINLPPGNTLSEAGWKGYARCKEELCSLYIIADGADTISSGHIAIDPLKLAHFYLEEKAENSLWVGTWNLRIASAPNIDENNPLTNYVNADGNLITIIFDEILLAGPINTLGWTVYVDGIPISLDSIVKTGQSVALTLQSVIYAGQQVDLYYDATLGQLEGSAGPVQDFSTIVSNGSTTSINVLYIETVGTECSTDGTLVYIKFNQNITGHVTNGWQVMVAGEFSPITAGSITDSTLTLTLNTAVNYKIYTGMQVIAFYDATIGNITNTAVTLVLPTTSHNVLNYSILAWTPAALGAACLDYGMSEASDATTLNNLNQSHDGSTDVSEGSPCGYWRGRKAAVILSTYAVGYSVYRPQYTSTGIYFDPGERLISYSSTHMSLSIGTGKFIGLSYTTTIDLSTADASFHGTGNTGNPSQSSVENATGISIGEYSGNNLTYVNRNTTANNIPNPLGVISYLGRRTQTSYCDGSDFFIGTNDGVNDAESQGVAAANNNHTNLMAVLMCRSGNPYGVTVHRWFIGNTVLPEAKRKLVRQWLHGTI